MAADRLGVNGPVELSTAPTKLSTQMLQLGDLVVGIRDMDD